MSQAPLMPPRNGRIQSFNCQDLHQQASMLRAWNQQYCQISPGVFDGCVTEIDTGAVHITVERMNRAMLQRGELPKGCIAVGIPLVFQGHARLCGYTSHIDGLHFFSGRDGFEFVSPENHLLVDVEFYPERFAHPLLREALERIGTRLGDRSRVLDMPSAAMGSMRSALRTLLGAVSSDPQLLDNTAVRESFEKSLVFALSELLETEACDSNSLQSRPRNWQLVKAAWLEIENTASDCPLSVAELVSQLQVSRRSLQYAFNETLAVNPAGYLRIERLNRVRQVLSEAHSVTEAATRFGFWHFGHFAAEYRALFGELPSETFRTVRESGRSLNRPPRATPFPPSSWLN